MDYIVQYNPFSQSAKALTLALNLRNPTGSNNYTKKSATVLCWGKVGLEEGLGRVLNPPSLVQTVTHKTRFFDKVAGHVNIPEHTSQLNTAMEWLEEGHTVMGRTPVGSQGTGIYFFEEEPLEFARSALFVKYIKKEQEYRIHVMNGKVISLQRKVLRKTNPDGTEFKPDEINWRVRSYGNGFIFQRANLDVPSEVLEQAVKAVTIVGLDFGAVDVIWNKHQQKAYVLEINTAPALSGTTLVHYVKGFKEHYGLGKNRPLPKKKKAPKKARTSPDFHRRLSSYYNLSLDTVSLATAPPDTAPTDTAPTDIASDTMVDITSDTTEESHVE